MALGTTNISTDLVGTTLGTSSRDVGTLCSKAKTGGLSGFAFRIVENGYADTDGLLIAGALPYFNIWSTEAPGEWKCPTNPANSVYYQLKRDDGLLRYCFMLGSYRGYNHSASEPTVSSGESEMVIQTTTPTEVLINAYYYLGSYDWTKTGATKVKLKIYKGSTNVYSTTPVNLGVDTTVFENDIAFNEDLRALGNIVYTIKAILVSDTGTELGVLPYTGSYTILVVASSGAPTHENEFNVNIDLPVTGVWSATMFNGLEMSRSFIPDTDFIIAENPIYLQSIHYILHSATDNSIISTQVVTSFGTGDKPQVIYSQKGGYTYIFKATPRVEPISGQWLEVAMNYDYN